jgi:hypothetical protein
MFIDLTVRLKFDNQTFLSLTGDEREDLLDQIRKQGVVVCEYHEIKLDKEYGKEGVDVNWHLHESTSSYACESCIEIAQDEEN